MTPLERAHYVRDHLPAEGLFAEKTWRIAPSPFALSSTHVELIEKLGIVLHHFNQACNLLYRQSAAGKAHANGVTRIKTKATPAPDEETSVSIAYGPPLTTKKIDMISGNRVRRAFGVSRFKSVF